LGGGEKKRRNRRQDPKGCYGVLLGVRWYHSGKKNAIPGERWVGSPERRGGKELQKGKKHSWPARGVKTERYKHAIQK